MRSTVRPSLLVVALACGVLALAGAGAGGCAGGGQGGGASPSRPDAAPKDEAVTPTPTPGNPDLITGSGTVRFLDLEGGFYGIVADDESRYDPGTLDPRFRHDGLRVRFDLRLAPGQMSTRQWGTLVTVVRLDSL